MEDVDSEWKKVERDMTKAGLKNGISDGRELNFQKSFDKGYVDGFRNGFQLGQFKFLRDHCKGTVSEETEKHLENVNKAMCIVCATEKQNENVADVREKQSELIALNTEKIHKDLSN